MHEMKGKKWLLIYVDLKGLILQSFRLTFFRASA